MLHHPFFGIIDPEAREATSGPDSDLSASTPATESRESEGCGRRGFFGQMMAGAACAVAVATAGTAAAQEPGRFITTKAIGEEGGRPDRPGDKPVTTQALGEEGSGYPRPPVMTTKAIGEEGGPYPRPNPKPPGDVTTYALGEEGGPRPIPQPRPPGGTITTYALGEEGSWGGGYPNGWYYSRRPRYYYREYYRD